MSGIMGFYLPSVLITSTSLIVMLMAALKRTHLLTNLITTVGLSLALLVQLAQLGKAPYQTSLILFDGTTTLVSTLLILAAWLLSLFLFNWLQNLKDPKEEYYLLLLLSTQGALIVCASQHFASFFLGLEIMSLSLVPMIAYPGEDNQALEAGIKYLVLSAIASAFMLLAIAILYLYSGTLSIPELATKVPELLSSGNIINGCAIILLLVGITFKLSLVPCHLWVADVYEGAPVPTTALLATVSKVALFVVLLRLFMLGEWHNQTALINIIEVIAAASMIIGNLLALLQKNLMRLLAYSSIAHFGYILLAILALKPAIAISNVDTLANEAAITYLYAYLTTVVGIFLMLMLLPETHHIDQLKGLFWQQRCKAVVLTLLLLSLAGIPLTIGFIGKFYLTLVAVNAQLWWLLAALIIGSVMGLFYYLRIILVMIDQPESHSETEIITTHTQLLVMGVVILLVIGGGVFPSMVAELVKEMIGLTF
ncbi:MAG: NADH-quinone oxidoreductase subunit N [Methylococcales bacterium]